MTERHFSRKSRTIHDRKSRNPPAPAMISSSEKGEPHTEKSRSQSHIPLNVWCDPDKRDEETIRGDLFEDCPLSIWEEDFSLVKEKLDDLVSSGVTDLEGYFDLHPDFIEECVKLVRIIRVNRRTLELYGVQKKDSLLRGLPQVFLPNTYDTFRKGICAMSKGFMVYESETINRTFKGDTLHILLKCSIASGYEQTWGKVYVSIVDITPQKMAEKCLKENEENYRNVVERANDGIVIIQDDVIAYTNPRMATMLGYEQEELLNTSPFDYIHPGEISSTRELYTRRLAGEESPSIYTIHLQKRDGTYLPVEINAGLTTYQGKLADLVIIRDVTPSKKMEQDLKRSRERYWSLIESAPDGIIALNLKGIIIECNSMALRVTGLTREEVIGNHFSRLKILRKQDLPTYLKTFAAILRGTLPPAFETTWVDDAGNSNYSEIRIGVIKEDGKMVGIQAIARDINERKKIELQIQASLKEKEILLKEVHHRVKNNLQVVSSLLNLQSGYVTDETTREMFKESQDRIRSMALVHEKLYQSKNMADINFSEYVCALITDLARSFGEKSNRITTRFNIDSVLLDIDTAITCGLIITELISNSYKHAFPENLKGTITVSLHQEKDRFVLAVSDTGIGLSRKIKINQTASLGLRLVSILVEDQLGGKLTVKREEGTHFYITFPRPA
ncbi:MAG: PAS domain S-box protein [Theionarchaea archaeon]|nr:PAS domain S-box protein [Theionarchaea archaeon]